MLAEATTTEISTQEKPDSFNHSKQIAKRGWNVAGEARKKIEQETGKPVISSTKNLKNLSSEDTEQ
jgi:hypothetical protein